MEVDMGRVTVACYRPREGREGELMELVREHVPLLRREGLVTSREATVMRGRDGTLIEVFEWTSGEAVEAAHVHEAVKALWDRFAEVSEFVPFEALPEAGAPFPDFQRIEVGPRPGE